MKTEHLLIIRFSAMGDVAMTVPVIYSLAQQYPQLRISVLSRPYAQAFFDNLAPNVDFMAADLKQEYRKIRGLNKLYRRLTAKQFTAVADFHDTLRSKYLRMRFFMDRPSWTFSIDTCIWKYLHIAILLSEIAIYLLH